MQKVKYMFSIVIFLIVSQIAASQEQQLIEGKNEKLKEQWEQYIETLNLSDLQKEQYHLIGEKYTDQMTKIRKSELSKLEKLKAFKKLQSDKEREIKSLLTEEQYKLHLDYAEKQKNTLRENTYSVLNLTDDQKRAFYAILDNSDNKIQALGKSTGTRLAKFKKFRAIQKEKDEAIKALLDKEQYEKYKDIQKEHQDRIKERIN